MTAGTGAAADTIVTDGSYAGLSAAMMPAQGRRSVLVLDAGQRRNRFAAKSHCVLAGAAIHLALIADNMEQAA
jgi:thioredoxin reductase